MGKYKCEKCGKEFNQKSDKTHFYKYCDVNHWTKDNPNDSNNKPYVNN